MNITFNDAEQKLFDSLKDKSKEFLHKRLTEFCEKSLIKFCAGEKEHGGLITDRPALPELKAELIDAWMYAGALEEQTPIEIKVPAFKDKNKVLAERMENIALYVCEYYKIARDHLFNGCREQWYVNAKWTVIYLSKSLAPSKIIGSHFGISESIVNYAIRELEDRLSKDRLFLHDFNQIKEACKGM